jgi:deoxyadenosine/deoxycytidine kinase
MSAGGRVVVLEGVIGVGKSTLSRSLLHWAADVFGPEARVVVILENIDPTLLQNFLCDQAAMAFGFQMYAACARLETMREAEMLARQGNIVLVDRGLLGDATFARMHKENNNITQAQWQSYCSIIYRAYPQFAEALRGQFPAERTEAAAGGHARAQRLLANYARPQDSVAVPIDVVYLQAPPAVAFERMKRRSIQAEVDGYTLAYFEHLGSIHDTMLRAYAATIELDFSLPLRFDEPTGLLSKQDTAAFWLCIDSLRIQATA